MMLIMTVIEYWALALCKATRTTATMEMTHGL